MCGVAGIFDLKATREIDRDALHRMTNALAHRGPDGEGFFHRPGLGLGHRRLAIIDIDGGDQPFLVEDGRAALSFNGEIYNYETLRARLTHNGANLKTRSDTEALTIGLHQQGAAYLEELRGMFAFAFWREDDGSLLLARDRLGEKPLYYTTTTDGFLIFASELSAIKASGLVSPSLNHQAVADYLYYGYVPDPKTIYAGVQKLAPGQYLTARQGRDIEITRYWRPSFTPDAGLDYQTATANLKKQIDGAVHAQMISDVPLGAFLSGGVDSTTIVSAMSKREARPITCTVGFEGSANDERAVAARTAARYGADHHEETAQLDIRDLIDRAAAGFGEPFADTSAIPSFMVCQMARRHVTVALSGDGGDEIFAGYRRYPFYQAEERVRALAPEGLRRAVFGPAGAVYPKLDWAPRPFRLKTTLQSLAETSADAYARTVAITLPQRIENFLTQGFRKSLNGYEPQSVIRAAMDEAGTDDPLARAQYADLATWLPGRMLVKVDRMAMANSLEVRPPLLDHKLVEAAGALPSRYKLNGANRKRILKDALRGSAPDEVLNAKKRGFELPLSQWLQDPGQALTDRLLGSSHWRDSGFFDEAKIETLTHQAASGSADCAQEVWSLIMFDAFLRL